MISSNYRIMDKGISSTLQNEELKDKTIERFKSTHEDLKKFYDNIHNKNFDGDIDQEFVDLNEYFLSVGIGYDEFVRFQISWGGPQEEIRMFRDGRIEFCFLDWFVGYSLDVTDDKVIKWLKDYFIDKGFSYDDEVYYSYADLFNAMDIVKSEQEVG